MQTALKTVLTGFLLSRPSAQPESINLHYECSAFSGNLSEHLHHPTNELHGNRLESLHARSRRCRQRHLWLLSIERWHRSLGVSERERWKLACKMCLCLVIPRVSSISIWFSTTSLSSEAMSVWLSICSLDCIWWWSQRCSISINAMRRYGLMIECRGIAGLFCRCRLMRTFSCVY